MKNQSAIEFMSVIALGLTLIAVASFFGAEYIVSYFKDIDVINARQTIESIVSSTNLVYAQGAGATSKVYLNLPSGMQRNKTYVFGDEINIRLSDGTSVKDIFRNTKVNVYGSIPLAPGRVSLTVKMLPRGTYSGVFFDGGAVLSVNELEIPTVYVRTYKNSDCNTSLSSKFNTTDTIYYGIHLWDNQMNEKSSSVNVAVYYPNGSLYYTEDVNVGTNGYCGNFTVSTPGYYLISVMPSSERIVGTTLFEVG